MLDHNEPEISQILSDDDLLFIFILDRSGSMGGPRMETAKEAVKTFLRSLPSGSSFSFISFGDNHEVMKNLDVQQGPVFRYNDATNKAACDKINKFQADMGGTNILDPLEMALSEIPAKDPAGKPYRKRIFMLTDGQVPNA